MKKPVISILSTLAGAALGAGAVGKVALDKTKKVQLMSDKHLALFLMISRISSPHNLTSSTTLHLL